jgi:hypothetical protein
MEWTGGHVLLSLLLEEAAPASVLQQWMEGPEDSLGGG